MKFAHFFVDRPIFSTVVSIFIVLIGGISAMSLPIAQYPEIAPPTIQVRASYPGASAETLANTVASPLEEEINGVQGMLYLSSQSTGDGSVTITVTFELGTDLDAAQVLVQNRVAIAEARLPESVRRLGVTTRKNSPDLMMVVHMYSPGEKLDSLYVSNYASLQIEDRMLRLSGVGQVQLFGGSDYSMRIWLNPERIAELDMTASDVVEAVRAQNVQVAAGSLNQAPVTNPGAFQLAVETQGRLEEVKQFERIIVKAGSGGKVTRLGDVARIELGARDYNSLAYLGTDPAVAIAIFQRPGSNALEAASEVRALMKEASENFPDGLAYDIIYDPTAYIAESVDAVEMTIYEAIVLVVLVVILFLQSWRASIIPILAIPISLIGTFAMMSALGYSINNLTLFGMVLAIGIVVDDAIVVVENIERNLQDGLSPKEAAHKTMDEVGGALIAIALVLAAVFIPTTFVEGISGQFYRQFAVTIATATAISALVSLTLSPALSAILLKHKGDTEKRGTVLLWPVRKFFQGFNWAFDKLSNGYARLTGQLVRFSVLVLVAYAGLVMLTAFQFERVPTGFIPAQDQGYFITVIQLPPGSTLERTDKVVRKVTASILEVDGVSSAAVFAGFDGATFTNAPNAGAIFVTLEDFETRAAAGVSYGGILNNLRGIGAQVKEANIFVVPPPPVPGVGNAGGFKGVVEDRRGRGVEALEGVAWGLAGAANQSPMLTSVFTTFNTGTPKIYAEIDRVRAEQLNIPIQRVFDTLETYLGSAYINDFNLLGKSYRVTAQADSEFRRTVSDVAKLRTRNDNGDMTPLGSVAEFRDTTGPYRVLRYNLYPSVALQGNAVAGISTGEALAEMERLAAQALPDGFTLEWTELSLQEKLASGSILLIFGASVIFVFLLLAAQYESWALPFAVILIVPMCLLAAVSGVMWRGMDNNILTQIGLVVLVGLSAKNAILIVEFARQAEDAGMSVVEAAVEAARVRLRPILMTSLAFILGVVPLMIASGAGSEMRQALGTAVFFGMLGVTGFGLLFTPVFYVVCRRIAMLGQRLSGGAAKPDAAA